MREAQWPRATLPFLFHSECFSNTEKTFSPGGGGSRPGAESAGPACRSGVSCAACTGRISPVPPAGLPAPAPAGSWPGSPPLSAPLTSAQQACTSQARHSAWHRHGPELAVRCGQTASSRLPARTGFSGSTADERMTSLRKTGWSNGFSGDTELAIAGSRQIGHPTPSSRELKDKARNRRARDRQSRKSEQAAPSASVWQARDQFVVYQPTLNANNSMNTN